MNKKYFSCLILFYCLTPLLIKAQTPGIKDLKIGDQCPDFIFPNLINYPKATARLSDFKGRLVILDFWATWCGPCLSALPKLDSLQKHYGVKIMILPVTYEATEKVNAFIVNSPTLKKLQLPSVTKDTQLGKYFRHNLIPHEVCIDGNGKVIAITNAEDITQQNIDLLMAGYKTSITAKKDIVDRDFNNSPLLVGGLGKNYTFNKADIKFSSLLTNYIDGLPSTHGAPNVVGGVAKIISTNSDIAGLYQTALGTRSNHSLKPPGFLFDPYLFLRLPARTSWEVKDTALRTRLFHWVGRSKASWKAVPANQKLFCYELILPEIDSLYLNQYALEDLNHYFGQLYGIVGGIEKRNVKCWILTIIDRQLIPVSKGGTPDYTVDDNKNEIVLKNYKINDFMFYWTMYEMQDLTIPIIDETHFAQSIDLDIKVDPKNITAINKSLEKYGLQFKLEDRKLDMIVIKDSE